jgi:galactonate dehydratase
VLATGAVDILQPDISPRWWHLGSLYRALAEAYDRSLFVRSTDALAASLQIDACVPHAIIQEQSLGIHYNVDGEMNDYVVRDSRFDYADGWVRVPDRPGLGIEINESAVRAAAERGHDWRNPIWRHTDGSIAEW